MGEGKLLVVTRKFTGWRGGGLFPLVGEGEAGEVILFRVKENNIFPSA